MSFIDNTKIVGIIAMIVGIISLLLGGYGGFKSGDIGTVGGAVSGLMLLILGLLCYLGKFDSKPEVVSGYLMIYGLGFAIIGILGIVDGNWAFIVDVLIGLLAMFLGYRMYSGSRNGPIWWYILALIFIILVLMNLFAVFDIGFGNLEAILSAVATVLTLVFNVIMLLYLIDRSVKNKFSL